MATEKTEIAPVRILPDDVANKIAAGEVVERPASVVKELVENALDARATRITVHIDAAGRRLIEVLDNGHGMSEQNALLAVERHATSKIRAAEDLEDVRTMGFRGEALASIAAVSKFVLITRRAQDEAATRISIDGGTLRKVEQAGAPVGTRVSVNRLYFNTPVRAKFLKGVTTELGHCVDIVQRHALAREGVGFQLFHNDKILLDVPEHATLRERAAIIWGLHFVRDMIDVEGEQAGFKIRGLVGLPGLTRAARSHQFFFMNGRPVVNRTLQYGLDEAYRNLITIGRSPVGVLLMETHPRFVDVNIHPTKREIRFRDDRVVRDAVRDVVRAGLAQFSHSHQAGHPHPLSTLPPAAPEAIESSPLPPGLAAPAPAQPPAAAPRPPAAPAFQIPVRPVPVDTGPARPGAAATNTPTSYFPGMETPEQDDIPDLDDEPSPDAPPTRREEQDLIPEALYAPVGDLDDAPLQVFDTYLLVPSDDRLLIIDQHALHERLNYDSLYRELQDREYESQQLAVPIMIEVAPSQVKLLEANLDRFRKLGIELEPFGGTTFQVTAICHLYDEKLVRDAVYRILDELGQGDLFDKDHFKAEALRLALRACKASVRGGDRLTPQERRGLLDGFRRLRPPYTCPHGRPIIVELTQRQMEKSFKRIQ